RQPPPTSTPLPYTTLFRSSFALQIGDVAFDHHRQGFNPVGVGGLVGFFVVGGSFFALAAFVQPDQVPDQKEGDDQHHGPGQQRRSEEHTSELQLRENLVCC